MGQIFTIREILKNHKLPETGYKEAFLTKEITEEALTDIELCHCIRPLTLITYWSKFDIEADLKISSCKDENGRLHYFFMDTVAKRFITTESSIYDKWISYETEKDISKWFTSQNPYNERCYISNMKMINGIIYASLYDERIIYL